MALDPKKFINPQLKISIDVDAGGQNASAGFLSVIAHIFDGKTITPTGFLMHKQIKNYPFGSAAHEYTDLPTDYPIRKLFIESLLPGSGAEEIFNTIKLSEDNDRKIILNNPIKDILRSVGGNAKPYRETQVQSLGGSTGYFFITPTYFPKPSAISWQNSNNPNTISIFKGDGGRGSYYCEGTVGNLIVTAEGYCPHGVLEIPFGIQDDPADWYDTSKIGSLLLDILSGGGMSSSYSCQIALQQLRNYA